MSAIDFTRMRLLARHDLVMHRSFYRSMAITVAAVIVGVSVLGFLLRATEKAMVSDPVFENAGVRDEGYSTVGGTAVVLAVVASVLMCVFAGCINHPLRSKQGRIVALTLPASNSERFLWHSALMLGGGAVLITLSLLVADGLTALLSLAAGFPAHCVHSVTLATLHVLGLHQGDAGAMGMFFLGLSGAPGHLALYVRLAVAAAAVWTITAYVFGGSLRYRYNILLTYAALAVLQITLNVLFFIGVLILGYIEGKYGPLPSPADGNAIFEVIYWCVIATLLATTILMWRGTWRRYCRAEVTSAAGRR